VAGAPFGTVANIWDGIYKMADGDLAKGAEQIIPLKLAQNVMRATRYGTEGMTDTRGNVVMPEESFGAFDLMLRGMGFSTGDEAMSYEARGAVNTAKYAAENVRRQLIKDGVEGGMKMTPEIREFNTRHPGNRITMSTLLRSRKQLAKLARERSRYGVRQDNATEDYLDEAAFAED
jgi:hypothetical protein